ncbi:hypothetical protein MK280_05360, partial [Myxococcota bacterium]|nr:hypothetical protein [Myxococcota bacterium]
SLPLLPGPVPEVYPVTPSALSSFRKHGLRGIRGIRSDRDRTRLQVDFGLSADRPDGSLLRLCCAPSSGDLSALDLVKPATGQADSV